MNPFEAMSLGATAMSDDEDPVTDERLLRDARTFIREVAAGQHADRLTFDDWPLERHVALAQVAYEDLAHKESRVRQAAAWVVGALDVHEEKSITRLCRLLRDRVATVRMAAAWACTALGEDAAAVVPHLIGALADKSDGVQFAAAGALKSLGVSARPAVDALIALTVPPHKLRLREQAVGALAEIAPDDPAVRTVLLRELAGPEPKLRLAAACGILDAGADDTVVQDLLESNLESDDPYLVCISAWAVGQLTARDGKATPKLLAAMGRMNWMPVTFSELGHGEAVSLRDELEGALGCSLPVTDDEEYASFRTLFFRNAFHPSPKADQNWVYAVVNHPWYLKVQRRRFGHPSNAAEREARRMAVRDAQGKFAVRLLKNPTLGVTSERFRELPGFIKQNTRNIAWRFRQKMAKEQEKQSNDVELRADPRANQGSSVSAELKEIIETLLPKDERDVARYRWVLGETVEGTAAALQLTPSKVKTREAKARKRVALYLGRIGVLSPPDEL